MAYKARHSFYDGQVLGFTRKGDAVDVSPARAQDLLRRGLIVEVEPTPKENADAPERTDKMQRPHSASNATDKAAQDVHAVEKGAGWYDIVFDGEVLDTVRGQDAKDKAIERHRS